MKRSAFTLVELLVVIAIIALLAALLIPAISLSRERARRMRCVSQQRDLAIALITYDKDKNGLPGYLNQLGETPIHSWAVAIFPMIGENKRYDFLMNTQASQEEISEALVSIPALLCPSDNNAPYGEARLNYVVNCGPQGDEMMTDQNFSNLSLFKDRRVALALINKKVKIEDIPDGVSNMVLLSENRDAGVWAQVSSSNAGKVGHHNWELLPDSDPSSLPVSDRKAIENMGFVWSKQTEYVPNFLTAPASVLGHDPYPRPSSKHVGTFVVAYADGTAKALNDDIDLLDWLKTVCPDDAKAKEANLFP